MFGELELAAEQSRMAANEGEALAFDEFLWARFAIVFGQFRLVVEQIEMRWRSDHVQIDDPFCRWGEVRFLGQKRIVLLRLAARLLVKQRCQRNCTDAKAGAI